MITPFPLESLRSPAASSATVFLPGDRLAEIKQDALLKGRGLGYQQARDELGAQNSEITSRLVQKLQEITFSHFEARKAVMSSLEPLIKQMVTLILPGIASEALVEILSAQVLSVAATLTDGPVRISCAPQNVDALKQALDVLPNLPVQAIVTPDVDCAEFEARITAPESEQHIDLDRILAGISDGVNAFFTLSAEEQKHG